jgi:flagellar biosynthesis protein FlhF
MSIKKFIAANSHEAMQEVRSAFGRDAIIISNRTTEDGIEIIATDNPDDLQPEQPATGAVPSQPAQKSASGSKKSTTKSTRSRSKTGRKPLEPRVAAVESGTRDDLRESILRQEIADLQGAVQGLTTSGSVANGTHWAEITLAGRLMGLGLGASLVQQVIDQARPITKMDSAWKQTLKHLKKQLRYEPGAFTGEGGAYVFHGPVGAGKTSVICKLAAQFLTENTVGKLAIVSAGDSSSIERRDGMLKAFSQLLSIPVHHAETPSELRHVLAALRRKKLVLIDTPAFDVNRLLPFGESTGQLGGKRKVEHCLVVSATTQGSMLDHTFACLAESAVESVVLTQIDQTRQIGTAIDSLLRSGLQLRYCADSADLHRPLLSNATETLISALAEVSPVSSRMSGNSVAQIDDGTVANWLEPAILV